MFFVLVCPVSNIMLFKSKKAIRYFTLISGVFFLFSMGSSTIQIFLASNQSQSSAQAVQEIPSQEVDAAEGYRIVLQREPNNQTALKGLLEIQLSTNQWPDAVQTATKLAALNPKDPSYPTLIAELKEKQATPSAAPSAVPNAN
jgi:predicted Zn-dependent protease